MVEAGAIAPEISAGPFLLSGALAGGPVLLAFFKVSCPTCQLAFPFLDRIHAAPGRKPLRFVGISQDDEDLTRRFNERCGVSFETVTDSAEAGYKASNAYGLSHVPSMFVVEADGRVAHAWTGFSRKDMEKLGERLGAPVFKPSDDVPPWKAG